MCRCPNIDNISYAMLILQMQFAKGDILYMCRCPNIDNISYVDKTEPISWIWIRTAPTLVTKFQDLVMLLQTKDSIS